MIPPLPAPSGPGEDGGQGEVSPRYEDIAQDGRMQLTALMPGLGRAVWGALLSTHPALESFRTRGILPILRRLVIVGCDRSVSVHVPVHYEGSFRFAREKGGDRLFVNMWAEARAPVASTFGPAPDRDAPCELVGRIFAEHVITRPFAPPAERKVTKLDAPGLPSVPETEHVFEPAEALLATAGASAGTTALLDGGHVSFGRMHTDSNQHVNSLVYPRLFEEAAIRTCMQDARFSSSAGPLLARALEIRWRKPFFAGDHAALRLALVEPPARGDDRWTVGAVGAFVATASAPPRGADAHLEKPSCTLQMWLR